MNKDRVVGTAKEIKGAVKTGLGEALGDDKLRAEGQVEKAKGKVQNTVGVLKDALRE